MEHIWELVTREWRLRLFTKHFGGSHCLFVALSSWGSPGIPEGFLGAPQSLKFGPPDSLSGGKVDDV